MVAVADGDTLTARCGKPGAYRQVKVRIAEIDAPDRKGGQPYSRLSQRSLADLCARREAVIQPQTTDKYARTVARVECAGQDVSLHQVRAGMAWFFVKYGTDPAVRDAEVEARAARRGLWADQQPVAPWVWRHPDQAAESATQAAR